MLLRQHMAGHDRAGAETVGAWAGNGLLLQAQHLDV